MNFAFVTSPLPAFRTQGRASTDITQRQRWRTRRATCCSAAEEPKPPPASAPEADDVSFSSLAAGPGTAKRSGGRLGSRKRPKGKEIKIEPKTAKDFIAEGIVDDVESPESMPMFEAADIRFGVGDVKDPFFEDEARSSAARSRAAVAQDAETRGVEQSVTGDGGVVKRIVTVGEGGIVPAGAIVAVKYTGTLVDGTVFDSTGDREPFEFVLGAGTVIKGWESGVSSMRLGEVAEFDIAPSYAYGRRGMPPTIPANATLTFTIELIGIAGGGDQTIKAVRDYNPDVARTPQAIAREYDSLLETQAERKKNMTLFDRFYIISPFASQTGEAPPWWLNPRLTFVGIFALVGVAFYLVYISGAIHQGYVEGSVDVNIFK